MPRFTVGARVRVVDEKTTDRVGTVREVLPALQGSGNPDHYRVELSNGTTNVFSDLQLSPAGSGPTAPNEDVV
jgi:hypothetical protein